VIPAQLDLQEQMERLVPRATKVMQVLLDPRARKDLKGIAVNRVWWE
jgi:hypothetical protein